MLITLLIAGSRGDIQPAIALGVGLKKAGYQVRLVTFEIFRSLVTGHGLDYSPIHLDMPTILAQRGQPELFDSGAMAFRFLPEIIKVFQVMYEQMARDFWEAASGSDALIGGPASDWLASSIAEMLAIPYINSSVFPVAPTRFFPTVLWPRMSSAGSGKGLSGAWNRFTYRLVGDLSWAGIHSLVNKSRRVLEMPPIPLWGNADRPRQQAAFSLAGFSELVLQRPPDWPANIHVTGYWFLDTPQYEPPPALRAFLEEGVPPVYIGFGSMPGKEPARLASLVCEALNLSHQRGVLFTGAGVLGQGMAQIADVRDVFFLEEVPHDWLFPRMAAVVHHGGAGTTAAGLRAGVPSVLIPVAGSDQMMWAQRIKVLGLGPDPIPRPRLTAERLADAIRRAVTEPAMHEQTGRIGEKIRAEDGVGQAVRIIDRFFNSGV